MAERACHGLLTQYHARLHPDSVLHTRHRVITHIHSKGNTAHASSQVQCSAMPACFCCQEGVHAVTEASAYANCKTWLGRDLTHKTVGPDTAVLLDAWIAGSVDAIYSRNFSPLWIGGVAIVTAHADGVYTCLCTYHVIHYIPGKHYLQCNLCCWSSGTVTAKH